MTKLSEKASEINLFVKLELRIPQKNDKKSLQNCVKNFVTKSLHYTRIRRNIFCYDENIFKIEIFQQLNGVQLYAERLSEPSQIS